VTRGRVDMTPVCVHRLTLRTLAPGQRHGLAPKAKRGTAVIGVKAVYNSDHILESSIVRYVFTLRGTARV